MITYVETKAEVVQLFLIKSNQNNGELYTWFYKLELSFFYFILKLHSPVCSIVPASLQVLGCRLSSLKSCTTRKLPSFLGTMNKGLLYLDLLG